MLLDDLSTEHSVLATHIKRWADHNAFPIEIKNGAGKARPKRIVITSNFDIRSIFTTP